MIRQQNWKEENELERFICYVYSDSGDTSDIDIREYSSLKWSEWIFLHYKYSYDQWVSGLPDYKEIKGGD